MNDIEFRVHSWELIGEIYKNSDFLKSDISPLIKKMVSHINGLPKEVIGKTIMLNILTNFISLNGVPIKENQILIFNELTKPQNNNILHLFKND